MSITSPVYLGILTNVQRQVNVVGIIAINLYLVNIVQQLLLLKNNILFIMLLFD